MATRKSINPLGGVFDKTKDRNGIAAMKKAGQAAFITSLTDPEYKRPTTNLIRGEPVEYFWPLCQRRDVLLGQHFFPAIIGHVHGQFQCSHRASVDGVTHTFHFAAAELLESFFNDAVKAT